MDGQVIAGRYRLVRVLGKGGMGAVWLAEQLSLHTPVAIKLIDFEAAKNPNARARFEREAQVVARIRSAHVVKVLDHGVTEAGLPFIAMECLVGESLRERITSRKRLSLAETAKVVSHVCRALAKAHEAGLVHRDLKPENIFVAKEDDGEIVKILDFGVAKATDILTTAGMDPTRTGALLGTPYYMSPEQAQGQKNVDHRSDLWAVGVLAFECLTGKRPFTAPALGPLIAKIVGGPIPTFAEAAPDAGIPAELDAWLRKALSRDPAARFASAREMADAFLVAAGVMDTMDRSGPMPAAAHPHSPAAPAPSGAPWAPAASPSGAPWAPAASPSGAPWTSAAAPSAASEPLENAATVLLDPSAGAPSAAPTPFPLNAVAQPSPAPAAAPTPQPWTPPAQPQSPAPQWAPPQSSQPLAPETAAPLSTTPLPVKSNVAIIIAVVIAVLALLGAGAFFLLR
jgi:serine/threonine-protein kinase